MPRAPRSQPAPSANGHARNPFGDDPIAKNLLADALNRLTANMNTGQPTSLSRMGAVGLDDPRRSIEDECGYPPLDSPVAVDLYRQLFDRNPIANRAVQLMPREAWQKIPTVYEEEGGDEPTEFEEAWDDLGRQLGTSQSWHSGEEGSKVWDYLIRGNIRSRIGTFGLVLALIDDGKNLQEPVDGLVTVNWQTEPVLNEDGRMVGVRRHSPKYEPVMPDSPITVNEWRNLTKPPPKRTWVRFDKKTNQHIYKETPGIPLTKKQRKMVNNWAKERRLQGTESFNPPFGVPTHEIAVNELNALNAKRNGKPSGPGQGPPQGPNNPPSSDSEAGPRDPQERGQGRPPLEPNNTFPEPYQTGQFNPFGQTSFGGEPHGQSARSNQENPGAPQALFRTQSGGTGGGTNIAIPGAYGTDRQYGTSDGAMSAGYGMAAPSGYGQLSGTDQQYYGVQIGPSEQPSTEQPRQKRKLIKHLVYDETLVQVVRYEWNINNPRFGMPVMYRINLNDPRFSHSGIGLPLATIFVHWSRVLHITDKYTNASTSEIFSPPVLEPILENILDIRKIPGAAAEGYWQSGIPTWVFQTHPQLGGDVLFDEQLAQDTMEKVQNSLQKWLAAIGGQWDLKAPTVTDPQPFVETLITLVCIQLACPVRIFKGSERGELASSQDDSKWNDVLRGYQSGYLTPYIICPYIDWMILLGVLPEPEAYYVEWPDLDSMTDAQKATVFQTRVGAYAQAESGGVYNTIPKKDVMTKLDFFTEEEAEAMEDEAQKQAEEDMQNQIDQQADLGFEPEPAEGFHDPEQTAMDNKVKMQAAKTGGGQRNGQPPPGGKGAGSPPPKPPKPPSGQAGQDVKVESLTGNERRLLSRFWRWLTMNSNPEGHNQYTGMAPHEKVAAAIARVSQHGRSDEDVRGDHEHADKMVEEMSQHSQKDLYQHLSKGGLEGVRKGDSKAGMLQRLHNRLTATARARQRAEV